MQVEAINNKARICGPCAVWDQIQTLMFSDPFSSTGRGSTKDERCLTASVPFSSLTRVNRPRALGTLDATPDYFVLRNGALITVNKSLVKHVIPLDRAKLSQFNTPLALLNTDGPARRQRRVDGFEHFQRIWIRVIAFLNCVQINSKPAIAPPQYSDNRINSSDDQTVNRPILVNRVS